MWPPTSLFLMTRREEDEGPRKPKKKNLFILIRFDFPFLLLRVEGSFSLVRWKTDRSNTILESHATSAAPAQTLSVTSVWPEDQTHVTCAANRAFYHHSRIKLQSLKKTSIFRRDGPNAGESSQLGRFFLVQPMVSWLKCKSFWYLLFNLDPDRADLQVCSKDVVISGRNAESAVVLTVEDFESLLSEGTPFLTITNTKNTKSI